MKSRALLFLIIMVLCAPLQAQTTQPAAKDKTLTAEQERLAMQIMGDYLYFTRLEVQLRHASTKGRDDLSALQALIKKHEVASEKLKSYPPIQDPALHRLILSHVLQSYIAYELRNQQVDKATQLMIHGSIEHVLTDLFKRFPLAQPLRSDSNLYMLVTAVFHRMPTEFKETERYAKLIAPFYQVDLPVASDPSDLSTIGASGSPSSFGHPAPDDGSGFQSDKDKQDKKKD